MFVQNENQQTVNLPVVAGVVYPCALPSETGEATVEVDEDTHEELVNAWNTDGLAVSFDGKTVELTKELRAKVKEELEVHPSMKHYNKVLKEREDKEPTRKGLINKPTPAVKNEEKS